MLSVISTFSVIAPRLDRPFAHLGGCKRQKPPFQGYSGQNSGFRQLNRDRAPKKRTAHNRPLCDARHIRRSSDDLTSVPYGDAGLPASRGRRSIKGGTATRGKR